MFHVIYSENALKDLRKLEVAISKRIIKKIAYFASQSDISSYCKPLKGFNDNKYRFRIGDYRAIFKIDVKGKLQILMILNIKHR